MRWLKGQWTFHKPTAYDEEGLESITNDDCDDDTTDNSLTLPTIQLVYDFVCNVLPKVGTHVSSLSLAHAGRMEIKYVR